MGRANHLCLTTHPGESDPVRRDEPKGDARDDEGRDAAYPSLYIKCAHIERHDPKEGPAVAVVIGDEADGS